ncbi:MAG TPA: ribonuclease III [Candidatus Paceibacterota bacterium]|nr:ribonuclease III [Candidatus Paceibacterota bacterium]
MDRLGLNFNNPALLEEALTHRSYLNEHPDASAHNERLEFLGDAVLELASTDFLYRKYPEKQEGELTSYRAALVNTASLAAVAKTLGIGGMVRLSKGEARDNGRARENILADSFEAIIGALYLDQGYAAAESFAAEHLFGTLESVIATGSHQDAKSRFQELSQDKRGSTPSYTVLAEEGPDHARIFTVGAYIGQKKVAEGKGKSKQEAEQAAAGNALKALGW